MSQVLLITSPGDIPSAVAHARENVAARYFVARRAMDLGMSDHIPAEWTTDPLPAQLRAQLAEPPQKSPTDLPDDFGPVLSAAVAAHRPRPQRAVRPIADRQPQASPHLSVAAWMRAAVDKLDDETLPELKALAAAARQHFDAADRADDRRTMRRLVTWPTRSRRNSPAAHGRRVTSGRD